MHGSAEVMMFTCNNDPRNCNFFVFEFFICLKFKTRDEYVAYIQCDAISTCNDLCHLATEMHRINFHIIGMAMQKIV